MVGDRFTGEELLSEQCSDTKDRIVNLHNLSQRCFVGQWWWRKEGSQGDIRDWTYSIGWLCSEMLLSVIIPHV